MNKIIYKDNDKIVIQKDTFDFRIECSNGIYVSIIGKPPASWKDYKCPVYLEPETSLSQPVDEGVIYDKNGNPITEEVDNG